MNNSPYLIVGMHRSGTSLLARMLEQLGFDLGADPLPADSGNPDGYHEDQPVVSLNRQLLQAAVPHQQPAWPDWGWSSSGIFRPDAAAEAIRPKAAAYLAQRSRSAGDQLWGWKDPRTTLLLPFWQSLSTGARVIGIYRQPWDVAAALARVRPPVFLAHPDWCLPIWEHYNRRLLEVASHWPERSLLLNSQALAEDPQQLPTLLKQRWNLTLPDVDLRPLVRNDRLVSLPPGDPLETLHRAVFPETCAVFDALQQQADLPLPVTGHCGQTSLRLNRSTDAPTPSPPRLAVIVPTYNQGDLLLEAIASVERHSAPLPAEQLELQIIDDGSSDPRSRLILQRVHELGYRVLHQINRGLSAARNAGLGATSAPVVLPLDDDNHLLAGYFSHGLPLIEQHPELAAVYGDSQHFGLVEELFRPGVPKINDLWCTNRIDACALIRRDWIETCGGYDELLSPLADWDLWLGIVRRGGRLGYLAEPCFSYRHRPGSMLKSHSADKQQHEDLKTMIQRKHPLPATANSPDQTSLKVHLFTQIYASKDKEKLDRLIQCLEYNLAVDVVSKITVLNEGVPITSNNERINVKRIYSRASFSDIFLAINEYTDPNATHIAIANGDIMLSSDISRLLPKITVDSTVAALTRHELDGILKSNPFESQDTWIFKKHSFHSRVTDGSHINLGIAGCEHLLAATLYFNGYNIWNPSADCKTIHNDPNPSNAYTDRLYGCYLLLPTCKVDDVESKQPEYQFMHRRSTSFIGTRAKAQAINTPPRKESILVAITNYDFNQNAEALKGFFEKHFPTILIDSSSPTKPQRADIVIPNNYYPGLWNRATQEALEGGYQWLLFIASDVQVLGANMLIHCIREVTARNDIAVWTPSLRRDSRFYYQSCAHHATSGMRQCAVAEGFCFLAKTTALNQVYPVPQQIRYGWGIDRALSFCAQSIGLVVVDDRVQIFHPQSKVDHSIDLNAADAEGMKYVSSFKFSPPIHHKAEQLESLAKSGRPTPSIDEQRSLDLGCGGHPNNVFNATHLWGIDLQNSSKRTNIKVSDLAVESIPFDDCYFDYVTAFDFIEHIPRVIYCPQRRFAFVELMNEIFRVLKPGALFLSLTPAFPRPEAFSDPTHVNFITDKTFLSYFCEPLLWGKMYGFSGKFILESQIPKDDGKLMTLLRAHKEP
ncbi:glycosyltransferase [Synechococcus sp. CCY9202]|uniref:glycosyltransferase n=1 Tax=Synechococcus sp. CCY9202 TaxID=174698 RepID=UPI002B1FC750|nr:glycosyltransferase [Synechococcus sp. CCY9202]MEA5422257.1 glycosyltransferase [Synechococcus sp. CCY9202]